VLLTTLTGHQVDPDRPEPENFDIRDIAHALDQICRFSGQLMKPYSVAAHSLEVSRLVEEEGGTPLECLTALLHDAPEAYLQDLPTPVKILCPDYRNIENEFNIQLAKRFGTIWPHPDVVEKADKNALLFEKVYQANRDPKILSYIGRSCEKEFLRRFVELGGLVLMKKATIERIEAKSRAEEAESLDCSVEMDFNPTVEDFALQTETVCGIKKKKRKKKRVKR